MRATPSGDASHLSVLDGWRGVSIVLVLMTHLAPLGGKGNFAFGLIGMVLFLNLSGFLITSLLIRSDATVTDFLIRRFFRIVPLAWLYFAIVFCFQSESLQSWAAHFFFYANLPPPHIRLATDHMWSLCVEVQFYVGIALLFATLRQRGLLILPLLAVAFTVLRVVDGVPDSSVTWYRVDEILAGCTLALAYHGRLGSAGDRVMRWLGDTPQWALLALLVLSCAYVFGYAPGLGYLRPYLGALLIGATLANGRTSLTRLLQFRPLHYIAGISYALYVLHIGLVYTWLGSGDLPEKYGKRPLLLVALFVLAHVSTYYYERPLLAFGKRLSRRFGRAQTTPVERGAADMSPLKRP